MVTRDSDITNKSKTVKELSTPSGWAVDEKQKWLY